MTLGEEQTLYESGAIIGAKQFLHGDRWDIDLISRADDGVIGKIQYNSYLHLQETQPSTAAHFYNRIIRHLTYELIYQRKNDDEFYDTYMGRKIDVLGLSDEDLIIDLKLGDR